MKHTFLIKTLVIITLFLLAGRVVVSNIISTSGVELGFINEQIAVLRVENDTLKQELFLKSSLENIATEAAKLGFIDKKENFVLNAPLPIALR